MVFDLAYIGYFHASHTQIYNDTDMLNTFVQGTYSFVSGHFIAVCLLVWILS